MQFVFKSACFLRKQILEFLNSFISILNTKQTNDGIFSNKAVENWQSKNAFLEVIKFRFKTSTVQQLR